MKNLFKTKLLAIFLSVGVTIPFLSSCSSSNESSQEEYQEPGIYYEAYDYSDEDTKFALAAESIVTLMKDAIFDAAKKKANSYLTKQGNNVITKAADWLKGRLFYCLEIEQTPQPAEYTSADLYNKLSSIDNDIKAMQNTLDILKQQTQDNQYYVKFTAFINNYSEIKTYIQTPFSNLETLNGMTVESDSSGDNNTFKTNYNALAKSIEVSLRGEGAYAVAVEQQIEVCRKTLSFGNAILGEETSSSLLNSYGIFNIIRHFAEKETPWAHQRKNIEDLYLSSIIYNYRNAHALTIFDLAYQMNLLGCEELYLAPDGAIVAFKYNNYGESKWYYNAYPYLETKLKTDYSDVFSNFEETPISITDIDPDAYSKLLFLFGFYKQNQEQYNSILRTLDDFTRNDNENYYVLETQQNREYDKRIFGATSRPSDSKEPNSSFITFEANQDFTIDFERFKNCKKSEFFEFIELIKPYAGDKSLYDYLRYIGFSVPRAEYIYDYRSSGSVYGLALGIEKRRDFKRVENNEYPNVFVIYYVDIDQKVKDISEKSIMICYYSAVVYWYGACNNKRTWENQWYMSNSVISNGLPAKRGKMPYYYISLNGLSTSSKSGRVKRADLDTSW